MSHNTETPLTQTGIETLRAKAVAMGLDASAIDGFVSMDRDTLLLQAALWHRMAIAHQNRSLDIEQRSGEVVQSLFDLCREREIALPDAIYEAACAIGAPSDNR